ncbi:MAG: hypothetical protein VX589_20590 [Myxococcota bacterium]|nr:hypothetical protein [Myxococcota bacterium]
MWRSLGLVLGCLFPTHASAHGDAPAALGVLLDQRGQLVVVHTNIGLAQPNSTGAFNYLCPAMWAEESLVPLPWLDRDGQLSVVTRNGVFRLDQCPASVRPLRAWTGRLGPNSNGIAIEYVGQDSRLWDLRGPQVLLERLTDERIVSVMVSESAIWLASVQPTTRIYRWTSADGLVRLLDDGPVGDFISLRTHGPLSFVLATELGPQLYQVRDGTAHLTHQAKAVIHGPVDTPTGRIVLFDGILAQIVGPDVEQLKPVDWRCLVTSEGRTFACRQRKLFEVRADGEWSAEVLAFELAGLTGPDAVCPQENDTGVTCFRQWLHFGGEAGLVTLGTEAMGGAHSSWEDGPPVVDDRATASSCHSTAHGRLPANGHGYFLFFVAVYSLGRRSARRRR